MTYTAHDIINQALHLANLNNTDFLTYKEKVDYINSSFEAIYNTAINHDDLYWLRECEAKGSSQDGYTEYYLPEDFYQLRVVKSRDGKVLPRKSASEYKVGYEVINDTLRIYGYHNDIKIEYWPVPPFITYKKEKLYLSDIEDQPTAGYGDILVFENNSVYHIDSGAASALPDDETVKLVGYKQILGENALYTLYDGQWVPHEISIGEGTIHYDFPVLSYTGNIYVAKAEEDSIDVYSIISGKLIASFEGEITNPTSNGLINTEHNMLVVADDYKLRVFGREVTDGIDISGSTIIRADWQIYDAFMFVNNNTIYTARITPYDKLELDIVDFDSHLEPLLLQGSADTGYGILGFDGTFFVDGYMPETVLDYPNNLFYRAIAADLALAFLQKQGGDTTSVESRLMAYTTNLLRSLDSNSEYTRIKNVY